MADEANVAQGDTNAAGVSSDNVAPVEGTQATPAANVAAQETAAAPEAPKADSGLLGGANKEGETKEAEPAAPVATEYEDFKVDESLGFGSEEQEFFKSQAKEAGFDKDQAQKAVDMFQNGFKAYREAQEEANKAVVEKFKADNKAEWSGKPESDKLTLLADKAATKLGIKDYLTETGYVHDAKLLGVLAELGRFYSESTSVTGGEAGGANALPQNILWPNMKTNN